MSDSRKTLAISDTGSFLACLALLLGVTVNRAGVAGTPTDHVPRMHYADTASGRPFTKDPAVVRFQGCYWLYYSIPPYDGKAGQGWTIGVAKSHNLVDWTKAGELQNTGEAERKGFTAPGAIVLDGKIHLFYQTYGNGRNDAICHAWSTDGLKFTRNPSNPVFRPSGDWTCGRAIDADVIVHGDQLLLYWATRDPSMKTQMQGVSAAPLSSEFRREDWTQLNPDGPILAPQTPTELDDAGLDLAWEKQCIEAAAMARHDDKLYMFYAGGYNNDPQQIGVAVSDDGIRFKRLSDRPLVPNGPPGSWNSSESGHPFLFQDDDGRDYLFYQGNNTGGKSWFLSVLPIEWRDGQPVIAPESRLPSGKPGPTDADSVSVRIKPRIEVPTIDGFGASAYRGPDDRLVFVLANLSIDLELLFASALLAGTFFVAP